MKAEASTDQAAMDAGQAVAAVAHVNMEGRFLRVNERWCELSGYSQEELLGLTFRDITHLDDLEVGDDLRRQLMEGQIAHYSVKKRYLHKDGSVFSGLLAVTLERDADGTPLYYESTVQEIGNADELLKAVQPTLHSLEVMGEAAIAITPAGIIDGVTSAFIDLGGYNREELFGQPITAVLADFCDDDYAEHQLKKGVQRPEREGSYSEPLRIQTESGESRWVVPHVSNVFSEDGELLGHLLTLRDVTALKNAQIQAYENAQRYRELVEETRSIILRVDSSFRICFANEYAVDFFGYSKDGLAERSLLETLVPAQDPDGNDLHAFMYQMMDDPSAHNSYDQQNRSAEGLWVWVHWSVRAVRDSDGRVTQLLCVGTDITERKHAEIRADWYRQRSRRLADQLITSAASERSRLAEYLHDQIIQLLSLSNIRLGGVLTDVQDAGLEKSVEKLSRVRDVLGDAIAECRQMMDQLVPPLLYELGLTAALEHFAEKHRSPDSAEITVCDHARGIHLSRDMAGLLFRSVSELLMNALKYAEAGHIRVVLQEENTGSLTVSVEDDGSGFDLDVQEDKAYDGCGGFGLFSIRERLESVGGQLNISSVPRQGTTACIRVPVKIENEKDF